MNRKLSIFIMALLAVLWPVVAVAQTQVPQLPQTVGGGVQATAKVTAIDYKSRVVTLQDAQGNSYQLQATPAVKRFNNLKVGDTVTFTYQESVAIAIAKPGAAMPAASSTPVVTSYPGSKPGGQISQTQTATVTVQSIDMNKPEITVKTQDGRTVSMVVQDKKNIQGLKPGDVIQVTYTQALMIKTQ